MQSLVPEMPQPQQTTSHLEELKKGAFSVLPSTANDR